MAALDLLTLVGGKPKRQVSTGLTVDFLSVKIGASGLEIKETTGAFDFSAKKLVNLADGVASGDAATKGQLDTGLSTKVSTSAVGANNGVAALDSGGKVPVAQLPNSIMEYQGTYDPTASAGAGSPALADGTGNAGDVYRVTVAGSHNFGAGSITLVVGDYVIYNGSVWERAHSGADAVNSVNGSTGVVVLTTTDVAEGTNLYFTTARAKAAAVADAIVDGITDVAPSQNAVFDALALKANDSVVVKTVNGKSPTAGAVTVSTDDVAEGSTNKYYTAARARADVISSSVASGDTTHAPSSDAVFTAIAAAQPAGYISGLTNTQGSAVTVRQVVARSDSNVALASVATAGLQTKLLLVKDASIANTATGSFWEEGAIVTGFTALDPTKPIYLSHTAGGIVQDLSAHVAGDAVISLGAVLSATDIQFRPQYLFEY